LGRLLPSGEAATVTRDTTDRRLGPSTALLLVVASMVGTGVFTTSGFLLRDLGSPLLVLLVWLVGGAAALSGALAYAELGASLPENGGEYRLLGRIYHPAVGFVAGWTSLVVGFSAPIAASAIAFGEYLDAALGAGTVPPTVAALALVAGAAFVHAVHVGAGSAIQNAFAAGKVVLIVVFVAFGVGSADLDRLSPAPVDGAPALAAAFAVALVYVSYSYSGWNAVLYVAGEVRAPERTLPFALVAGTTLVTALYLAVTVVVLGAAPSEVLARADERVAAVAAMALFGPGGGRLIAGLIALGLVSTVSVLVMTGPRVYEAMGRDHPRLAVLARRRVGGGPLHAILLQTVLAAGMVLTATFDLLLAFVGLCLSAFSALTVAGVFVLRHREPALARPFRSWGHPATPLLFVGLMAWSIAHTVRARPVAALAAVATVAVGAALYRWVARRDDRS
jgi:APA family basic amino acid/polyamine antiporter